jgi:hypothetical protein
MLNMLIYLREVIYKIKFKCLLLLFAHLLPLGTEGFLLFMFVFIVL